MTAIVDGSLGFTAPVGAVYNGLQTGTAQASTSGTSIDFTGIPSWVKRITVMFNGVSLSATANIYVQIGSGSVTTSGYTGGSSRGTNVVDSTSAFIFVQNNAASNIYSGVMTIVAMGSNVYAEQSISISSASDAATVSAGNVTLGGVLDRVRITTSSGTDTFDAGSINIIYE